MSLYPFCLSLSSLPGTSGAGGKRDWRGRDILVRFDMKHESGTIVDIEYMVQYAVLGWTPECLMLSRWKDVMRLQLELCQTGISSEAETGGTVKC